MAWAPDYITSSELKHAMGNTNTGSDPEVGFAISAASRAIDTHCGRQFGVLSAAAPRYYQGHYDPARRRWVVLIEDLMTTTDLTIKTNTTDGGTFDDIHALNTDVALLPYNAAADNRPWTMISGLNGFTLPVREASIEITAKWGWTAVPAEVKQACLILAARYVWRKQSPAGIAGSFETGSELRLTRDDPDVVSLLSGLVRHWGMV